MKHLMLLISTLLIAISAFSRAKIMNPGETHGQLVFLSAEDVLNESDKYNSLSPLSIPVFAEMPFNMSVVAGAITLLEQGLLSHVQIKARARKIPNLDISALEDGLENPLFINFNDGDYVHMILTPEGQINIELSSEDQAVAFYKEKLAQMKPIELKADLSATGVYNSFEIGWQDHDKVGSKAANYAELARALNSSERTVVRPSLSVPFYYYQQFVEMNPEIETAIRRVARDPLMRKVSATSYRQKKLTELREKIFNESVVNPDLLDQLLQSLDQFVDQDDNKLKMKLRSSTNAEDLPDFNGAGLYTSKSYKPLKKKKEKNRDKKLKDLEEALLTVWSSVWNLRAFEERQAFAIPHDQVYMGVQINPSFSREEVDGVLVTKNLSGREDLSGPGVYIEAQRGDEHSVANPAPGVRSEKILVLYDQGEPLNKSNYQIHILAKSNVADDLETVLDNDNPTPMMEDEEIKDLVFQSLKAQAHFDPIFVNDQGEAPPLDVEFKVDDLDSGVRQVYLKQARPFIQ